MAHGVIYTHHFITYLYKLYLCHAYLAQVQTCISIG